MKQSFKVLSISLLISLTSLSASADAEKDLTNLITQTKNVNTDAVIIYKDGKIVYQYYGREYSPTKKHLSWSMAKTFSGILIGQAVEDGYLKYNDKVTKYFPKSASQGTVMDFLNMSSGVKYLEDYTGMPANVDVTKMLYTDGPKIGFANYVTSLPARKEQPGEHYYYSSGDTNVLMGILQKSMNNQKAYNSYPWKKIFSPLGITNVTFEQDTKGTFVGASYIYMSAPDYLKMGKLLMQKGQWNGQQIIPVDYFNLMNTVNNGVQKLALDPTDLDAYSVQVRTNQPMPSRNLPSQFGELPLDSLIFLGHQGQYIVSSPSEQLVIVRLGMDKEKLDKHKFFGAVRKLILEKGYPYTTVGSNKSVAELETESDTGEEKEERGLIGTIVKIPHLLRSYAGKEYCSCRLVVGRTEKACKTDLKAKFPVLPSMKIKNNNTLVESRFGTGIAGKVTRIQYRGPQFGCTIVETE